MHKFADVIFRITQKPLYITSSNLVRTKLGQEKIKLPFLRLFDNPLSKYLTFKIISCMQWMFWVIYQNYKEVWD